MVAAVGLLLAFALTCMLLTKLSSFLPKDAGRAFAHDGSLSAGKPRGAGIIFVLVFIAAAILFAPVSVETMIYLMLILGFLGWPSIARLVRGQILSLREQEFMLATEACGIKVWHRIFRHLIPNVIPQLIVTCTMGLGSTILTEATLSFLGLGVKYPFASWGNIINDVNNAYVMTNYLFIWIPAGVCLLLTVLGFNFVGDGLRDAFDPKMKR